MSSTLNSLNKQIISCEKCPRLVKWRKEIAITKVLRFSEERYWGKPVPGYGDINAEILLVGLAPAAHGANRTGRMFTGDKSGDWLYRALHKAGFSNKAVSVDSDDGLTLNNVYITATCRCAPPQNKPTKDEIQNCRPFILEELRLLKKLRVIIGLGKIGFESAFDCAKENRMTKLKHRPKFSHGVIEYLNTNLILIGSYHPSQQNTFTGKLTEPMFDSVFKSAKTFLKQKATAQ
jgi:uracil-DNA glycosylase family 4